MDFFLYPIECKDLLRKKNVIKRQLLEQQVEWIEKKIAILGGSTTNEVADQITLFLLRYGIRAEVYQSGYGQYWQEGVFGSRELDSFKPDIIYIHTSWRNIQNFPDMNQNIEEVEQLLLQETNRFVNLWEALSTRYKCPIIQNNFDRPNYRVMGNRDIWDYRGRSNFISRLNQQFYKYAQEHENFYINDLEYISQDYGLSEWNNALYWNMYKYAMCMNAIPYVAQSVANIIKSIYGKNKKVLTLDLDNTLWGGVVGDDGVEGIKIGPESSQGQVYAEFQEYCKKLKEVGVLLTINSKNEIENAVAGINHPDGILKLDDFVAMKANWNPKDQNLREMAEELTLGVDSFVFVDDNPAEREIVSAHIPGVAVPNMGNAEDYIKILDHSGYFEVTTISNEDLKKTEMYHAKAEASKSIDTFSNYEEYLDSLEMKAIIGDFKPIYIQRIAQLTNKSNQFNLTTLRCTEEDIVKMQEGDNYICLCGKLIDKFTDNGMVTVVIGECIEAELHIRLWIMSCRVLKRELENSMMNALMEEAEKRGIKKVMGYYYPTAKNGMVKDFYASFSFEKESEDDEGNSKWSIWTCNYEKKELHMDVENNL